MTIEKAGQEFDRNIAVAGMGYWGKNLVRNFSELAALRTVCDRDASRESVIKEEYPGVEFTTDFGETLEDPNIKAVALATPAVTHYGMARAAIEAGKDVYVEKPLSLSVAEGEKLVALATKHKRVLMVGHILRYHSAVVKLGDMIREGELGRIQYVYSNRLNMGKIRTEENILWSFAPHDISVILALLGEEPRDVSCSGGSYLNERVPDVTMSRFTFPSGVRAHIFVSWLHPFKEQRLVVVGSEKMAVFDDTIDDKLVVYPHKVEWKNRIPTAIKAEAQKVELELVEPLRAECAHFLDCVKSRETPLTDGEEGLRVLKILSACQEDLEREKGCFSSSVDAAKNKKAEEKKYFAHETACIDDGCEIGDGTKIWHFCHVMKGARIGERCVFGQNCNVDSDVVIGSNVKVQNNISIFSGVVIEDDVFLGPSCVLTNVTNPRSQVVRHELYEKTLIRRGATIGANSTIICGVEIGKYAFVAAGAVVTEDVPDYSLVMGAPARHSGWMSRHGHRLLYPDADGVMICPESKFRYREVEPGVLRCVDLDEEEPLPEALSVGNHDYRSFKK